MMSLLVREYPYLHKMDNLCVDFKKKTVKYEQDQKRFHVLRSRSGVVRKYFLDDETLKRLSDILTKRHRHNESVKEKVESLQLEMKKLKTTMNAQHEELKRLIRESLAQRKSSD
jgi:replicative superfamily II helicase